MVQKRDCEFLRTLLKNDFMKIRPTMIDVGRWVLPHRIKYMLSVEEGKRNNQHIVDSTHIIAHRSYVAGFLEGNNSTSRPWFRQGHPDSEVNRFPENRAWYDKLTTRSLSLASSSNLYHALGGFYYDFGCFNTACFYVDELDTGVFFHVLAPGSYYLMNNAQGHADHLVREFSLNVAALVKFYGRKTKDGKWDWSNFSPRVKKLYEKGMYTQKIDIAHIVKPNTDYDPSKPDIMSNRPWISITYETGSNNSGFNSGNVDDGAGIGTDQENVYLRIKYSTRQPFMAGRGETINNSAYGEKGPSTDALGLIKSLNKKAIGKDIALDKMLSPTIQGPANLNKSYRTTSPNMYVPLDPLAGSQSLKPVFEINPAIGSLIQDVTDLRDQVDKLYYADYLLYLTRNPKTRTATEVNAVVTEQQLIIGPSLQSLNFTLNQPLVDFLTSWVLENDPYLGPPPKGIQGSFLRTDFISIFAQAQKAADLPLIDRYKAMIMEVGQLNPSIWDKINLDRLADLYEDRLYLPAGLNEAQSRVDAKREKAMAEQQRQQQINEMIPNLATAAKNMASAQSLQK